MGYRKFKADYVFTGMEMLEEIVLITDDTGSIQSVSHPKDAGDGVQHFNGILIPGFINTHCHLELSHMKNVVPPGAGLIEFLTKVIKERTSPQEIITEAIRKSEMEMYISGTVAVADICNTTDTIPAKNTSKIFWRNFIEVIGFTDRPQDRFNYAKKIVQKFDEAKSQQQKFNILPVDEPGTWISNALTPHAPYSVSETLFKLINIDSEKVLTIHNQEAAAENEWYENKTGSMSRLYDNLNIDASFFYPSGKTSVQTYLPWLTDPSNILLVHNSFINQDDIDFISRVTKDSNQSIFYSTCINANRYIESINPPLELLRKNNCCITIGTDSYASNTSLNMLDEIKTIHTQFPSIKLNEILQWATFNGAKALDILTRFGSFEKNKKPGIVFINNIEDQHITTSSQAIRLL